MFSLDDLENWYVGSDGTPPKISNKRLAEAKTRLENASAPEPCPMKFLSKELKQALINDILESGIHASRIWILPFEFNEIDESRNVFIVCTIDDKNYNPDIDYPSTLETATIDSLKGAGAGRIMAWMTWNKLLEAYIPNLALPNYLPDWTI